jgi:peroxiredoxin
LVVKVVPGAGLAEEVGQPVPDWTVVTEISFQDDRTWRREIVQDENDPFEPQGQVGSFQVSTLKEQLVYDAASRTATVEPTPERTAAQSRLEALREMSPSLDQAAPVSDEGIRSCEVLADEKIAGRDAHHLQCTFDDGGGGVASGAEAWLDVETGVLLRLTFPNGLRFEVTDIEYGVSFPPGIFSTEPPDTPADPATGLAIGEEVPTWVLPALGGGMIDLASLRGEPTLVYVWATWCPVCAEGEVSGAADPLAAFDDAWLQHGASVNLVAVAHLDEESAVSRLVEDRGYTVPIALDGSGEALAAWGVEGIPLLVVLDAEGALAGAYLGDLQGPDVRAIVEAVTAGGPLPSVGGKTVEQLPS